MAHSPKKRPGQHHSPPNTHSLRIQPPIRHFSVLGIFGEANFDTVQSIGLGIGDMMFLPAPALPFFHPTFFTLASTVGPLGFYAPLFPATPTPWTSALGPSIPFPFVMTIQGVLEEAPGVFVPTNALIYEIK